MPSGVNLFAIIVMIIIINESENKDYDHKDYDHNAVPSGVNLFAIIVITLFDKNDNKVL